MEDFIVDENKILTNLIVDKEYQFYIDELIPEHFYDKLNKIIFKILQKLYKEDRVDMDNIIGYIKNSPYNKEIEKIIRLYEPLSDVAMKYQIEQLKNRHLKTQLKSIIQNTLIDMSKTNINDVLSNLIYSVNKLDIEDEKSDKNTNMALTDLMSEIEDIKSGKKQRIMTGIWKLDGITGGLKGGEMTIIAGRPRNW